jgi:hypothetical protein
MIAMYSNPVVKVRIGDESECPFYFSAAKCHSLTFYRYPRRHA